MVRSSIDENVLTAFQACQLGLIDEHCLVASLKRWSEDKSRRLDDILSAEGVITKKELELLAALHRELSRRQTREPRPGFDSQASIELIWKELETFPEGEIRQCLSRMCSVYHSGLTSDVAAKSSRGGPLHDPTVDLKSDSSVPPGESGFGRTVTLRTSDPSTSDWTSEDNSTHTRYTPLRLHAAGGLGKVFLALDHELNREVALKLIREEKASDEKNRQRFALEAEITGRIEHPGVVPIYGMGHDSEKGPYYAMRFVEGVSLKHACDEFHQSGGNQFVGGEEAVKFRQLLGRLVDVCNAVGYAHSRGVVHRDLKPDNIMLGKFGETLVVDWGLARTFERDPADPKQDDVEFVKLKRRLEPFQPGNVEGTPAYMSPEQAAGREEQLRPTNDVYALGAIFYTVLTGRKPIEGKDLAEILDKIKSGQIDPPRQVNSRIPARLEAICRKAMAANPSSRYETAQALGQDIERWLADEPVSAYREPWHARLRRWMRRHQAFVTSVVAAGLVLILSLLVIVSIVTSSNRSLTIARNDADANYRQARLTVDRYVDTVMENELLGDKRFQPLRIRLLQDAKSFYQDLAQHTGASAEERFLLGEGLLLLGKINSHSDLINEGEATLLQARDVFAKLAKEFPDSLDYRFRLADAHRGVAMLERRLGKYELARGEFGNAIRILDQLAKTSPTHSEVQNTLALANVDYAVLLYSLGEMDKAITLTEKAIDLCNEEAEPSGDDTTQVHLLSQSYGLLGTLQKGVGLNLESVGSFQHAISLDRQLVAQNNLSFEAPFNLAQHLENLADLRVSLAEHAEAEEIFAEAEQILTEQVSLHPNVAEVEALYADVLASTASVKSNLGKLDDALDYNGRAQKMYQSLYERAPSQPEYLDRLARSFGNIGLIHQNQGERKMALEHYLTAKELYLKLVKANPNVPDYRYGLGIVYGNLGTVQAQTSKLKEAGESFQASVDLYRELVIELPRDPKHKYKLAMDTANLAQWHMNARRWSDAADGFRQAAELLEKLLELEPDHEDYRSAVAGVYMRLALMQKWLGEMDEALETNKRTVAAYEWLHLTRPDNVDYAVQLGGSCCNTGNLIYQAGDAFASLEWFDQAIPVLSEAYAQATNNEQARQFLCNSLIGRASAYDQLEMYELALDDWDLAAEHDRGILKAGTVLKGMQTRAKVESLQKIRLAREQARGGDYAGAVAVCEESKRFLRFSKSATYDTACVYSLASQAAQVDDAHDEAERKAISEKWSSRAVELLEGLSATGFFDSERKRVQLEQDEDLDGVRNRPRFERLLETIKTSVL